jgi:hypothetical protein
MTDISGGSLTPGGIIGGWQSSSVIRVRSRRSPKARQDHPMTEDKEKLVGRMRETVDFIFDRWSIAEPALASQIAEYTARAALEAIATPEPVAPCRFCGQSRDRQKCIDEHTARGVMPACAVGERSK